MNVSLSNMLILFLANSLNTTFSLELQSSYVENHEINSQILVRQAEELISLSFLLFQLVFKDAKYTQILTDSHSSLEIKIYQAILKLHLSIL